jgi:FixJ family two-component response regulator
VEEGNALWRFVCLALQGARFGSWTAEVIRGKTGKEIARATGATERTIKAHRHRVIEKMQVRSLAELVSFAERIGILADAA